MDKEQEMGYLRDRTSQYKTYRTGTVKARKSYKSEIEAELNPFETENRTSHIIEKSNTIESKISMVELEMQTLAEMHQRRKRIDFGNDKKADAEIEAKTRSISNMIGQLRDIIRADNSNSSSEQASVIHRNMQHGYAARLRDITIQFRDMQASYIKIIKKQKDRAASFAFDDDEDGVFDDLDDVAFTDSQVAQVRNNENMLRQRNAEITNMIQMMNQLNQLFADLGTIIVEQGTMLDRIDGIVEDAIVEVRKGNEELSTAEQHQSSKCFYYYVIIVVVLIFIFGGIIIFRKGKSDSGSNNDQTQ
jgi:syntaxin 16